MNTGRAGAKREWLQQQRKIAAAKGMTLEQLRAQQPRRDRDARALRPAYVEERAAYTPWPKTVEELRERCREYGDAAVTECQWSCIGSWLWDADEFDLSNPLEVVRVSLSLIRERDRVRLGFPHHGGEEWPAPIYDRLSPGSQKEAERVASATAKDWERAGKPHLGQKQFKLQYQLVTSSPAWLTRHPNDAREQE